MALATTAAVAATTAAAAYLDAKLQIRKDLRSLRIAKAMEKDFARAVKQHRECCFYLFESAALLYPDSLAIWSREGNYTWRETYDRVCQYASYFLSLGVQPGSFVALYMQNAPEFIFAWIGLWAIGCAPALINWNLGADSLLHCIKISEAKIILVDAEEGCQGRIQQERDRIEGELQVNIITLSGGLKSEIANLAVSRPDDTYRDCIVGTFPAMLIFTSGTTGLPKAFPFLTSRAYMLGASGTSVFGQHGGPGGDRWYHGTGGMIAITCMMAGISLALARKFSVSNFWPDIRDSESTYLIYVGETARYLLAAPPSPLDKQHKVRCMHGNGLRPDVWTKFQERFGIAEVAEFFTSTEGMFFIANWSKGPFGTNAVGHHGFLLRQMLHNTIVPVTIDTETNDIYRSPATGFARRNSYSEGGEIIVKVPSTKSFAGYWRADEATAKKFVTDVFRKGDIYYRSGDALRRNEDGLWFFLDRLGDTYRWKSENVSTAEVAETLGRYPGILEANVYGVLVPSHDGRAGCAAVALDPSVKATFDWKAFATYVKEKLPGYAVPVFVRVMDGEVGAMGSHNNKQNKVPLREEGVDPKMKGKKVEGGEKDQIFWIGSKGSEYVLFREEDWDGLVGGKARL